MRISNIGMAAIPSGDEHSHLHALCRRQIHLGETLRVLTYVNTVMQGGYTPFTVCDRRECSSRGIDALSTVLAFCAVPAFRAASSITKRARDGGNHPWLGRKGKGVGQPC